MGDRTYTAVEIHKSHYKQLLSKYSGDENKLLEEERVDEVFDNGDEIRFICYEANYGEIQPLEDNLLKAKISYDKKWESGEDYGPGELYYRSNLNGHFEIYDEQKQLLNFLQGVSQLPPKKMKEKIQEKIKELWPFDPGPLKASNAIDFITED